MDTLSSLFSKKFKKDPPLLKFNGLNEDLVEGQKLISRRKRTQARIKKSSPLVEGFASQLSEVDTTEFKRTAHLNETLQKDLSSYGTAYRNVLSDYETAQRESQKCKEDCNSQYVPSGVASPPTPPTSDTASTLQWMSPEGWNLGSEGVWGGERIQGSPVGVIGVGDALDWCKSNPDCKGVTIGAAGGGPGNGELFASPDTEGGSIMEVGRNGGIVQGVGTAGNGLPAIYFQSNAAAPYFGVDAAWASACKGGCGAEAVAANAAAAAAAEAAAEDEASRELAIKKKQACLAGCGLSKAYLEKTNITGSYNNKTITECSALTTQCTEEDVTGCTTCESCYAKGPGWWCSDTGRCSTRGNPCTESCGSGGLQSTPGTSNQIIDGAPYLTDICNKSKNATQSAQNAEMDGRNLTKEYSALNEKYLHSVGDSEWMHGVNLGTEGIYGGERLAGVPVGLTTIQNAINWCKGNSACKGITTTAGGLTDPHYDPNVGGKFPTANTQVYASPSVPALRGGDMPNTSAPALYFESSVKGPLFTRYSHAALPGDTRASVAEVGGSGFFSSWCKGGCGQSAPQMPNILLGDTGGISNRIDNILSNRRGIQTNSRDSRQNLENTLKSYQAQFNELQNREQDSSTLSAMMSEGSVKKSSAYLKYYIWLGLAICMLIMAIRQLKK